MLTESNIRKIIREEVEKASFQGLYSDEIEFIADVSMGHMQLTLKFVDERLEEVYSKLMMKDFEQPSTIIDIETNNLNHIHISAIPYELRNLGLGKTIYRKVLEEFDYISTGFVPARISEDAQRVWESLIKSGDYFYFISTDSIRVTLVTKNTHPAVYETIIEYYKDNLESTNFDKNEVDNWDDWD